MQTRKELARHGTCSEIEIEIDATRRAALLNLAKIEDIHNPRQGRLSNLSRSGIASE